MKGKEEICRTVQRRICSLPKMICLDHYMGTVSQVATSKNQTICYQHWAQMSGGESGKALTRSRPNLKIAIGGIISR